MGAMNQLNEMSMNGPRLRLELPSQQFEFNALKFKLSEMRRQLSVATRLTTRIIESADEGILITDARRIIRSVNPAFEKSTGYSAAEAIGRTPAILKSGHHDKNFYRKMWDTINKVGEWRGEIWNRHKNGEIYPEWLSISAVKDSQQHISHYVGVFSDAHTQEYILERLHYLAYYDGLTGLPNRRLFLDRLNMSISHARRESHMLAVMFIDLDQFKQINDTLGHQVGDELLIGVTERMKSCLRNEDTLARLAGDEFTVLLPDIPHPDAARNVAQKFLECCAQPLSINGHELCVTASIGIAIYPNDGEDAESLLHHADLAMYRIKESGRNGYLCHPSETGAGASTASASTDSAAH
jgi:diguanylate cyclase (GGDEF)-like protein/PAS domain S-box-containing protein